MKMLSSTVCLTAFLISFSAWGGFEYDGGKYAGNELYENADVQTLNTRRIQMTCQEMKDYTDVLESKGLPGVYFLNISYGFGDAKFLVSGNPHICKKYGFYMLDLQYFQAADGTCWIHKCGYAD